MNALLHSRLQRLATLLCLGPAIILAAHGAAQARSVTAVSNLFDINTSEETSVAVAVSETFSIVTCGIAGPGSLDCDGNGLADECDIASGLYSDCNMNGVPDVCDIDSGFSLDCNSNGVPDACEPDCDMDGIPDVCELMSGAEDCNENGVPDECELADGTEFDCNNNGVLDSCEIDGGLAFDCDGDRILDSCELAAGTGIDCNGNGVLDNCDISMGAAQDCDGNSVPDSCQLASGSQTDCNGNGVLDNCDIATGTSTDYNFNGLPDSCEIDYTAMVEVSGDAYPSASPILFTGEATYIGSGLPAPEVPVRIELNVREVTRVLQAVTDETGAFETTFTPLQYEAGEYDVAASHPLDRFGAPQDSFEIVGIRLRPDRRSVSAVVGGMLTVPLQLQNLGENTVSGLTSSVMSSSMNVNAQFNGPSSLAAGETVTAELLLEPQLGADPQVTFDVVIDGPEGATTTSEVTLNVINLEPNLRADPGSLREAMVRGETTVVEFDVRNLGGSAAQDVEVLIPPVEWLTLSSPSQIGSIGPGGETRVSLALIPSLSTPLQQFNGTIIVAHSAGSVQVPFTFTTVSNRTGNVTVRVEDEFTYFAEGNPLVADALVQLSDPFTGALLAEATSDQTGIVNFIELAEGFYRMNVSAEQHLPYAENVFVAADDTTVLRPFLPRSLVTYSFNVTPTVIEDNYVITVEANFETDVPAPVVVVDPAYVDLNDYVGLDTEIMFTFTNYGLIDADEVMFAAESSDDFYVESLVDEIGTVPAGGSIQVPVRIRDTFELGPPEGVTPRRRNEDTYLEECRAFMEGVYKYNCNGDRYRQFGVYTRAATRCTPDPAPWIPGIVGPGILTGAGSTGGTIGGGNGGTGGGGGSTGGTDGTGGGSGVGGGGVGSPESPYVTGVNVVVEGGCDPCGVGLGLSLGSCALTFAINALELDCVYAVIKAPISTTAQCVTESTITPECYTAALVETGNVMRNCMPLISQINTVYEALSCLSNLGGAAADCLADARASGRRRADVAFLEEFVLEVDFQQQLIQSLIGFGETYFGDPVWIEPGPEDDVLELDDFMQAYTAAQDSASDEGRRISVSEAAGLEPLTPAWVAAADPTAFDDLVDRWNRTLDYLDQGIVETGDVPDGQSLDFLATDIVGPVFEDTLMMIEEDEANAPTLFGGVPTDELGPFDTLQALVVAGDLYVADESQEGVCATVRLQVSQQAVISRNAFDAQLQISNQTESPLQNLQVTLFVRDFTGELSTDRFAIAPPSLAGVDAIDGTGTVNAFTNADISWEIVPLPEATPEGEESYLVGGTFTYTQNGLDVTVPILPDNIQVLPDPLLQLRYYLEKVVYSDDPFTQEIEPAVPYSLGLIVTNVGEGEAVNMRIASAQPEIIENEQGLLVGFEILGAQVGAQPVSPSLEVNFGSIPPASSEVARWILRSSLQGEFSDYTASFEHLDAFGDPRLSLIESVDIYEMNHVVRIDDATDDGLPDFLVNAIPDPESLPDEVHSSDGAMFPVNTIPAMDAAFTEIPQGDPFVAHYALDFAAPSGFVYLQIDDPTMNEMQLASVQRSDGKPMLLPENAWTTYRIERPMGEPEEEVALFRLFDVDSTGSYTVIFEEVGLAPDIRITPAGLNFGETVIEDAPSSPLNLTVRNNGDGILSFPAEALAIQGPDAASFSIQSDTIDAALSGGETAQVGVTFSPTREGLHTASMVVTSSDPDEPAASVTLVGEGVFRDTDGDGVADSREDQAPNGGDANDDGMLDRLQPHVASLQNAIDGAFITVVTDRGAFDFVETSAPAPELLDELAFPAGFLSFRVVGLNLGEQAVLDVFYGDPLPEPASTYYKLIPEGFPNSGELASFAVVVGPGGQTVSGSSRINDGHFILVITDGGRGDGDGAFNGEIVDPGGPAAPSASVTDWSLMAY